MNSPYKKMPVDEVTETPKQSGDYQLYYEYFWGVTEDDCILLFNGYAKQCNKNPKIIENMIEGDNPAVKCVQLKRVWFKR